MDRAHLTGRHVFISYTREDAGFVGQLRRNLSRLPYQQWQDIHNLVPGRDWRDGIDAALRSSAVVLVVLSRASSKSLYVNYEWAFALGVGSIVVGILRESVALHPRLEALQLVDFTRPGKNWLRLSDAVDRHMEASGPRIRAAFELEDGIPSRVGREYVILLWVDQAPRGARTARFRIHYPGFHPDSWTERNPGERFDTGMQSYGDVPLSVQIRTSGRVVFSTTSLYQALCRTHRLSTDPAIRRALKDIEAH